MDLVYKNEKKLFLIAAILSGIFWFGLIIGTVGLALVYLLLMYLFFLFAHSAFITYLKGTGVKITEEQYPDLHEKMLKGCQKVGLKKVPDAYLLRTDFFNALATRFLGRNYVVLYTDVVDSLQDKPGAIDFYIGHELGHIHRKHLLWSVFVMPASILPLLGTALRRAEEYTCDRYGVACCESKEDIVAAISAIAAGDSRWSSINVDAYIKQVAETKGFWMSFNELTGDYPWLTKRMATAVALADGKEITHPRRSIFAWILSAFVPNFGLGGAFGGLIVIVAIIGILAAIAIPAYQSYTDKATIMEAYASVQPIKQEVSQYVYETQQWPVTFQDLGYADEEISTGSYDISLYDNGMIGIYVGMDMDGSEKYVIVEPSMDEAGLTWSCYGENIEYDLLPSDCQ